MAILRVDVQGDAWNKNDTPGLAGNLITTLDDADQFLLALGSAFFHPTVHDSKIEIDVNTTSAWKNRNAIRVICGQ
eukprot:3506819-Pyramimonas_sp.AAC.1